MFSYRCQDFTQYFWANSVYFNMYILKERKLSGEVKYTIHNEIKLSLIGGENDFDLLNYIFAKVHINPIKWFSNHLDQILW